MASPSRSSLPSFFEILGVPERFQLDPTELERRYKALSRQWHPDRWARAEAPERRKSLEMTTSVNDAYRVLRDPVKRAEYLLRQHGIEVAGEESKNALSMEFLEQVIADRERLMEAQVEGDDAAVAKQAGEIRARRDAVLAEVREGFALWEVSGDDGALKPLAEKLASLRYFDRFLEDVEGKHGP